MQQQSPWARGLRGAIVLLAGAACLPAMADMTLKASHQFPGGKGDVRDEMVQIIAREVNAAKVGLEIKVYPGASLVKANEQWKAMQTGQIDMTSFPLDYASGFHPQFGATLMLAGNLPGRTQTVSLMIYTATAAGDYELASKWVVVIVAISLSSIGPMNWWIDRSRRPGR